jgi:hypothetical protein
MLCRKKKSCLRIFPKFDSTKKQKSYKLKIIMKKQSQKLSIQKSVVSNLKENRKTIKNITNSWFCHLDKN